MPYQNCLRFTRGLIISTSLMMPAALWASPGTWQCLCYQERFEGAVVDATACRSTQRACEKLSDRVTTGSKVIVKNSLTRACTPVKAVHPADVLGHKDRWRPSKKPGAVWTPNGCLLPLDERVKAHRINDEGDVPLVHLNTGWVFKPVADEMRGRVGWSTQSANKTSAVTHLAEFPMDTIKPRCASILTTLKGIRLDLKNPIVFLSAMCAEEGIDVLTSQEYIALLAIQASERAVDVLWSGQGSGLSNEATGRSEWLSFRARGKEGGVVITKVEETCEISESDQTTDGQKCTVRQLDAHTIPYPRGVNPPP